MGVNITKEINPDLNLKFTDYELELRDYAIENNVPIIGDEGLSFLEMIIALYKPKNILEIGTAIGYSAERMARVNNSNVVTIERDEVMYKKALETIDTLKLNNQVEIIFKDALEAFDDVSNKKFDMIFIDAAKGQYKKFFEGYTKYLNKGGIVVCDNMLFHGQLENEEIKSRNLRALVRKIKDYHEYLLSNDDYYTKILDIGDGMSISIKK